MKKCECTKPNPALNPAFVEYKMTSNKGPVTVSNVPIYQCPGCNRRTRPNIVDGLRDTFYHPEWLAKMPTRVFEYEDYMEIVNKEQ